MNVAAKTPDRSFGFLSAYAGRCRRGWIAGLLLTAITPAAFGQAAPTVTSVTPANGATGVAVDSALVFRFSQDMDTDKPALPSFPPFLIGNIEFTPAEIMFSFEWGADRRTLTGTPSSDLPPNTTINWKLNPAGTSFPFTSAAGTALATTSGSFTTGSGGGGGGDEAPVLLSTTPADQTLGVELNVNVIFIFDQPMKKITALGDAIMWVGADAAKFTYSWNADGTQLTCDYATDFPAFTLIGWNLNPESATVRLESAAGEPLPSNEYSGGFMTRQGGGGGDCDPDGIPDEWGSYSISKSGDFVQTSTADPVPDTMSPFGFAAIVFSPDAGPNATAATVTLPGGTQKPLTPPGLLNALFFTDTTPTTAAELDTKYPGGAYTLRFTQTGQPERVIPMTMPNNNPPVPKYANYTEAQNINPAQDFTLRWNAFTGASASDYLGLVIYDGMGKILFQAPDQCVPRELPVTATSVVIPANTFKTGGTYEASLTFSRLFYFSTNTVANMVGSGGLTRTTRMTMSTSGGGPAGPARFVSYELLPNGNPEMTLTGTAGKAYRIERTANLTPPVSWGTVGTVNMNVAGVGVFQDTQAGKVLPLYYRAVNP